MVGHRYPEQFLRQLGMPNREATAQSHRLEDQVLETCKAAFSVGLEPSCLHIGSEIGQSVRLSYFAASDSDVAQRAIAHLLTTSIGGAIDAPLAFVKTWQETYDLIQPSEYELQTYWDQEVIDRLLEDGSDPTRPHPRQHWIIGAGPRLAQAARDLEKMGCRQVELSEDQITCFTDDILDPQIIFERTWNLIEIADRHGLEYDGWEAPVVPRE
jgi:regulator of RNase E activity RraB